MASDRFERQQKVQAGTPQAWAVLTDVQRLASWVSVLDEVEEISHLDRYRAVLQDRVGPLKLRANLDVSVQVLAEGSHVRVKAYGRDSQVNSAISIDATLRLEEGDSGTEVVTIGSYQVTGRVATMGGGIIRKKAKEVLEEFFSNVQYTLGGESTTEHH